MPTKEFGFICMKERGYCIWFLGIGVMTKINDEVVFFEFQDGFHEEFLLSEHSIKGVKPLEFTME